MSAVADFGHAIREVRYDTIGIPDRAHIKARLLYAIGSSFAARPTHAGDAARSFAASRSTANGLSSFWLSATAGSAEDCAFANSILVHGALLDDVPVHTGAIVIPTSIAVGEAEQRSGADLLAAIAIGYELVVRLDTAGGGLGRTIGGRGFRHSWFAAIGGAAAAAYLMRLEAREISDALALVVTLGVPGTMAWLTTARRDRPTSERYVQIAANARQAVLAASLARGGFAGVDSAFEGANGLFEVYGTSAASPPGLTADFGKVWHIDTNGMKQYPGTLVQPVRPAERLGREHAITPSDVERIVVRMPPWGRSAGIVDLGPFTNLDQALCSTAFAVAAALLHGAYDVDVARSALGDRRVDDLAQRITFANISDAPNSSCEVEVVQRSGQSLVASVADGQSEHAHTDIWSTTVDRFHDLARHLPANRRTAVITAVDTLDQEVDCRRFSSLLTSVA